MEKLTYLVKQHGLLFIVGYNFEADFGTHSTTEFVEDSRWENQEKAIKHCKLLNNE